MLKIPSKKILIVDMTHGGQIIATEFAKSHLYEVFAWDIYNTMRELDIKNLVENNVILVDEEFLKSNLFLDDLFVIAPVHCNLDYPVNMTHHEAVNFLMKDYINVPILEVTGVKGKTSTVHMLKEIFKELNPLVLSSLGVEVVEENEFKLLKKDISITPANIIYAWKLAHDYNVGVFIIETSLGGTGLAEVGVLTNIIEDYSIAGDRKRASQAKIQIFKSRLVACDYDSLYSYYTEFKEKTNSYGIRNGNVRTVNINFNFHETVIEVEVKNLKTLSGQLINDLFEISTFAPANHHVQNILSAVCVSLTFGISKNSIITGLKNFHGLKGRTSINYMKGVRIIEEVNPGLNSATIKKCISMLEDLPGCGVVFGGKYGVTCEEVDEHLVSNILSGLNDDIKLILTDELGCNVKKKIKRNFSYFPELEEAMDYILNNEFINVLLIYRSIFPDLLHR